MGTTLRDLLRRLRRLWSTRTGRRIEFIKAEMVALRRQMAANAELVAGSSAGEWRLSQTGHR